MVKDTDKRLIYIVSSFPCYSEAFILREMIELKKRRVSIDIFSLRRLHEPILQKEVLEFLPHTHYLPFVLSFRIWIDNLYWLLKAPVRYIGCLLDIVLGYIKEPVMLLKTLGIFPKAASFAKFVKNNRIRHIHAHFATHPTTAALIIHRLTQVPFTFSCHAHDIFYSTAFLEAKLLAAKWVFTVSQYNKEYIFKLFPRMDKNKLEILRSPADCQKYNYRESQKQNQFIILSVGRLANMKGFFFLIEACASLKKEGLNFICYIVGDGPLRGTLQSLIKSNNLEKEVRLLGSIREEQLMEEYRRASVFVLPCVPAQDRDRQDGLPAVLVEAMACGIPVISTSISGIPELVINNATGILVTPKDTKSLTEAIKALYQDEALRFRLAQSARKKVEEECNIQKNVDRLMQVFFAIEEDV